MAEERCVCCGEIIPEEMMVCPNCERNGKVKLCEYCAETPELQRGVVFPTNDARFRYRCPRCNITSKSCYTIEGAIEAWNRGTEDGK